MPPLSFAVILLCLIASKSEVFPWSTCPIIVTTGGRGFKSSSLSSFTSIVASSCNDITFTLQPKSSAIIVAVSESIISFTLAIVPIAINFDIISEALKFIFFAKSPTVIVSIILISFSTLASLCSCCLFLACNLLNILFSCLNAASALASFIKFFLS